MSKTLVYLAIITLLFTIISCSQKLVCYSKTKKEGFAIYKYFYGIQSGTYLDVNPKHPIWDSDTIYLNSKGWRGINLIESKETFLQFNQIRSQEINLFSSTTEQNGLAKFRLPQICQYFAPKSIELLIINENQINSYLLSQNLPSQSCKPETILVRLSSQNQGINKELKEKLLAKNYTIQDNEASYVIFIENKSILKYRNLILQNERKFNQNDLQGFSKIVSTVEEKKFNQPFTSVQLKGNLVDNKIFIHFSKARANINVDELIKNADPTVVNIIIMQMNPQLSKLLLKQNTYQSQMLQIGQQFYHITYQKADKTYHIYVFDHNFQQSLKLDIIPLSQIKTTPYNFNQIDKYDINDIDRLGNKNQTQTEQVLAQQKQIEQQKKLRKEIEKQTQELKKKQVLLQEQIERLKKVNKSSNNPPINEEQDDDQQDQEQIKSLQSINSSSLIKKKKQKKKKREPSKEDIAYLTPQTLFANKQVKNTTILVIILVFSVIGSIMLTAFVTALIMKKRHRAQIRSRIKTNAEMQSEMNAQNQQSNPSFHQDK